MNSTVFESGEVVSVGKTYIIFDVCFRGSILYVPDPSSFTIGDKLKLIIHNRKFAQYGFRNQGELNQFIKLTNQKGWGPKRALKEMGKNV